MQGMQIQSLGQEDPPKKGMATHSSVPWDVDRGACLYPMDRGAWWATYTHNPYSTELDTIEAAEHVHICYTSNDCW